MTLELPPERRRRLQNELRKLQLSRGERAMSEDEWQAHVPGLFARYLVRAQYLLVDGRTDVSEEELQEASRTASFLAPLLAAPPEDAERALAEVVGGSLDIARLLLDAARASEIKVYNVRRLPPEEPAE